MRKSFPHVLLFFICFITFQNINAQLSRKHFIPPLTYAEVGNANPEEQYIYISTPSNQNVSYTVTQVGSTTPITGIVTNTSPKEISIGTGNSQLFVDSRQTSIVHSDKGYIIEASDVVYVSVRVLAGSGAQAGALVSKGASALGTSFRAGMFTNENPQDNYLNFISVMATEDNTIVDFDDLPTGILIKNYSGSLPISVTLNEGDSYIVATNSSEDNINKDGLIGTLIESDKDIVVNIGSANGSFHNGSGRDYGIDQIVGVDKIGSEYIFVKGEGSNGWENVLIVAHENNTDIFINGKTTSEATINAGEYYLIEGNEYNSNGNMYVQTSLPVFAYQGIGANTSEANQGLFFVPPLSCENRGKVDNIPNIEDIGATTFDGGITIVTNKGATININARPISEFTALGPFDVDGNTEYVTYKVTNLLSNTSIESSGELYCAYFNQNGAASSGSFFSGFPSNPEIKFDVDIATLGNCLGNGLELQVANLDLFDTYEWFFNNVSTGITTPKITPTQPGNYKLVGIIVCDPFTLKTFESTEIPVSICPDDYDKDGIIDNLDVDIDNDGILNCDESLGNKTIDLSNINIPTVEDDVTTITSSLTTESTTFIGNSIGDFISTANAGATSNSKYTLTFTDDNINFKLTQNTTKDHTISSEEYFIIRLSQANKNITLVDPDNQILVDSNFDDEFEDDFTQFSSSVIKFKFKSNLVGSASTFQFVASQIKNISFEHYNNNSSAISTFNGTLGLTCFSLDSDGDGIENMFDLDADNDGIPDLYDAYGQDISLTKTDANLDGLDDVFGTITTNLDADADGVKNYLDYDADNDGIYDVIESGNGVFDTDNDGKINGTVGTNGLLDDLETSPDSGVLKTPLKNSDSTTLIVTNQDSFFDFIDLDSDGDNCFDVIEAEFTGDASGRLSPNYLDVDNNGKVINSDGYINPINTNYTTSAPIIITTFEDVLFCEGDVNEIEIETNASTFQWQISVDDGISFVNIIENSIIDDTKFNNVDTSKLKITAASKEINNYQFRVQLNKLGNTCGLISNTITLIVNPKPIVNNPVELFQCDNNDDYQTTFNLTEAEINITNETDVTFKYYATELDAKNDSPEVADKTSYFIDNTGEAWVKTISNTTGCYSISKINLTVSYAPNETFNDTIYQCDDFLDTEGNNTINNDDKDGITFFDLSSIPNKISTDSDIKIEFYESDDDRTRSLNEITETQNLANYRNKNNPYIGVPVTIFYKLISITNNNCQGIGEFYLEVNKIPEFTVEGESPGEPIIICTENIPYTLYLLNPADTYNYQWTNKNGDVLGNSKNLDISNAGEYTVTASTNSCSRSRTITVYKSDFENLEESFVTITDDLSIINSNLNIRIDIPRNPLINEDFLYALEDENGMTIRSYQDSNVFEDIEGGIYKIIVENKNGCGSSELIVSVIQFPKFFTPNGDRKNDTWAVKGVNTSLYQSNSTINIFNRYGKLIAQTTINSDGWDGTYNGKLLASNDYWFSVQLIPIDTEKKPILKKGHFSLLRK
ncbi:T9SS type B sorting domain-containing protein [Polaribacter sp. R2A056_3_33]|uniref:T9SS type B sorting domain-containing protein n=1 Tax=Polaribacter sp. R2A056_3_33 TaxID=2745563 RepID=UPI001C4F5A7C|nr:T9SS type B sorting domain-containing protein [Polaribacter sp. R2A056_3_33]QXP69706.1 T9SS type B sorting domain-containing protein [Polaribacter sp. R2A056_3_33]